MQYSSEACFEECKRKTQSVFDKVDRYRSRVKAANLFDLYLDSDDDYQAEKELLPKQTCLLPQKTLL